MLEQKDSYINTSINGREQKFDKYSWATWCRNKKVSQLLTSKDHLNFIFVAAAPEGYARRSFKDFWNDWFTWTEWT